MKTQLFTYEPAQNVLAILDDKGNPLFLAKDICDVLGLENSRQAVSRLDEEDRITVTINDGNRGNPDRTFVTESGLYNLIFSSTKPEAKAFKKWVTSELLPTLRKTGKYDLSEERLEKHFERPFQIQNSKAASGTLIKRGDIDACKHYHTAIVKELTGKTPSELKEEARLEGIPAKQRTSGKEVVRTRFPVLAPALSLGDRLVSKGYTEEGSIRAAKESVNLFKVLEEIGEPLHIYC